MALCKQSGEGGEIWQQSSLLDISRSGASVLTALPISQGDELKVWIPLEEVDHILEVGTRGGAGFNRGWGPSDLGAKLQ